VRTLNGTVLAVLSASLLLGAPLLHSQTQGAWVSTANMSASHVLGAQAALANGKVLIAGGSDGVNILSSAELFNPATSKWTLTGSMAAAREEATVVVLSNGKVLIAGGVGTGNVVLATAELYDPVKGTWSAAGTLSTARAGHTATLLKSGEVLVAGGCAATDCSTKPAAAELYNPVTNTWSTTGSLGTARFGHTAGLLPSGKVLVVGGSSGLSLNSCELYDPASGTWSSAPSTATARYAHAMTVFKDGKVLVSGGNPNRSALNSAEIYDPIANAWTTTGTMIQGRFGHTSTLLSNTVAVISAGAAFHGCGRSFCFYPISSAETYDETTGKFTAVVSLNQARMDQTASTLGAGRVLVSGGFGLTSLLSSSEIYTIQTLTFSTASLNFGLLEVGLTSASQTFTVTNVSSASVKFKSIASTGDYAQTNNCPATLTVGLSCTVNVTFSPKAAGTRTGSVTLTDNSAGSPHQTIALTGTGEASAIVLTPNSVTFPTIAVGTTSQPITVTVTNDGAAPVSFTGIAISPADGIFTQTNNCPATINPGQNCAVQVVFTPPDSITFNATLSVTDNANFSPQTASLTGSGLD
jgi:N-acetylneuraminic acid mutarotase